MKKIFSSLMVAVFAVAMMTGGAWASEIDICPQTAPLIFDDPDVVGATSGAVTADVLWTNGGILDSVDLGDSSIWPNTLAGGSERAIGYYSSVALKSASTLKFAFEHGAIDADATMFLLAYNTTDLTSATPAGPGIGWVTVGTLNDFDVDDDGNYSWIRMQISDIIGRETFTDKTGVALAAALPNVLPADAVLVLSKDDAATGYDGVGIVANEGLSAGQKVTVAVTEARDDNANPLSAPLAASEDILSVISGVSAIIQYQNGTIGLADGACTSVIDVDAAVGPRLNFVDETSGNGIGIFANGDTDLTHSQAALLVQNTAEYGLTLNAGDTYTLTIKRDNVNGVLDDIDYDGIAMTAGTNEWTYDTNFGVIDPTAGAVEILITVDEINILKTGTWTADLTINPDQDGNEPRDLDSMDLLTDQDSHIWTINGWQAVYPYFNSKEMYGSYIVLNNESGTDGKVFFDIIASSNADIRGDLASYESKQVTDKEILEAGESKVYLMDELVEALGLTDIDAQRNALRITVTAPVTDVTGTAFMDDPGSGGKRTVPLLTNGADYRQW